MPSYASPLESDTLSESETDFLLSLFEGPGANDSSRALTTLPVEEDVHGHFRTLDRRMVEFLLITTTSAFSRSASRTLRGRCGTR